MHRKTATVPTPLHYPNRLAAQQPAPLKQPQHPLPHCCLHPLHTCFIHLRPAKRQPLPPLRHHPVQHAQMQMHVCVQRRAKTVHKQHPAAAACRRRACARSRCCALHFALRSLRHAAQSVGHHLGEDTTWPVHLRVHRQNQAHVVARRGQRPRERRAHVSEASSLGERSDIGRSKQDVQVRAEA